ncbi:MAG: DUF421 domain-containing protein [Dehalococcoidia bacterium]
MFYDGIADLVRTIVVGTLAYAALIASLRVSGKRTLTQMNAFDFVVTVALGSTLATVLLSSEVSLAEGVTAFLLLIGLQFSIAWLSAHWPPSQRVLKSEPAMLLYQGRPLDRALARERVTRSELDAALRSHGISSPSEVYAVVMETNGSFSVLPAPASSPGPRTTIEGVHHDAQD